jgi:hypothetical protein
MPGNASAIATRLKSLSRDIAGNTADQLELLVRFDELEGWRASGSRHCVAWMNLELGISIKLGWEYLRVGRRLRSLPILRAQFRSGSLTWSKVRLISRVATEETEGLLVHAALDASVSDLERLCNEYRWNNDEIQDEDDPADGESARAFMQFQARSLTWNKSSNGNTDIRLSLPAELAAAFLASVEQSLGLLEDTNGPEYVVVESDTTINTDNPENPATGKTIYTMAQKRADAAVLMAETSLQSAGREMATADRYQVIVTVDASELRNQLPSDDGTTGDNQSRIPGKRPCVDGTSPVARETARRIACDCSTSTITLSEGEPIDIGRKSRVWPAAMTRAIKARDQHCQMPGCTQTRNLQIHHIRHWADGGSTGVDNGVCLCSGCHVLVHEGGYRIERVDGHADRLDEQFHRQQPSHHEAAARITDSERLLRDSRKSFDQVRRLSPTRYRFRVVDANGCDIRDSDSRLSQESEPHSARLSTRVDFSDTGVADETGMYEVTESPACAIY